MLFPRLCTSMIIRNSMVFASKTMLFPRLCTSIIIRISMVFASKTMLFLMSWCSWIQKCLTNGLGSCKRDDPQTMFNKQTSRCPGGYIELVRWDYKLTNITGGHHLVGLPHLSQFTRGEHNALAHGKNGYTDIPYPMSLSLWCISVVWIRNICSIMILKVNMLATESYTGYQSAKHAGELALMSSIWMWRG